MAEQARKPTSRKNSVWVSLAILIVLFCGSLLLWIDVEAGGVGEVVRRLAADFSSGSRYSSQALKDFPAEQRQAAIQAAQALATSLENGELDATDCDTLIDLIKDAYHDGQLSLTELRRLTRELTALTTRPR